MRAFLSLVVWLWAGAAWALCDGEDLRAGLTAQEEASLQAALGADPYPQGNHWIARKGPQTLHLIGTLHLDDPRLDGIAAHLSAPIIGADKLLVEMSRADQSALQAEMQKNPAMLLRTTGPALQELMPPAQWEALKIAARDRSLPIFMVNRMQPWYLSMMLALPKCLLSVLQNDPKGLDHRLIDMAMDAGIPVESLEHYSTILTLFQASPIEEQIEMLSLAVSPAEDSENEIATMYAAYFEEKHAQAWHLSHLFALRNDSLSRDRINAGFAEMTELLLTGRNHSWMTVIRANSDVKKLTIAAGAAHLSGPDGLLNLLEQDGYTLERAGFLPDS